MEIFLIISLLIVLSHVCILLLANYFHCEYEDGIFIFLTMPFFFLIVSAVILLTFPIIAIKGIHDFYRSKFKSKDISMINGALLIKELKKKK